MLIGLAGAGLLWFDLRSLRRKVQERAKASSDPSHVRSGRDAVLASSFKGVAGGVLMVAFGVIGLLVNAGLLTRSAVTIAAWVWCATVIVAAIRYMFWGAPDYVWRWLLKRPH
jgi:hypothetical protein